MSIDVSLDGQKVVVTRTRKATPMEKQVDPEAVFMAEVVNVTFNGEAAPVIVVNRDLCGF